MRANHSRGWLGYGTAAAVGAVIAVVLLVPHAADAGPAIQATPQTRSVSCAAYDFHPLDSDTWYGYVGPMIYHHVTDAHPGGSGFFACTPGLPNHAIVKKVQFTVYDNFNGDQVRYCELARSPLAAATATTYQTLGQVPGTGALATPGARRLTDSTIQFATIDNSNYDYWLQCQVTAEPNTDQYTGIFGADVIYSIDPAKG